MKLYAKHTGASISMSSSEKFHNALFRLFNENSIKFIFESGTYLGLGSTTSIANAIIKSGKKVERFYTAEVNKKNYLQAKKNLAKYKFIKPLLGLTTKFETAIDFIKTDDAIKNHEKYQEVYIDNLDNPVDFYLKEIEKSLSKKTISRSVINFLKGKSDTTIKENLFGKYVKGMVTKKPLILLDSAGGMGFFEFQSLLKLMAGNDFFLILDDIHHLKHFRSYNIIREDKHFTILDESIEQGWVIAKYTKEV